MCTYPIQIVKSIELEDHDPFKNCWEFGINTFLVISFKSWVTGFPPAPSFFCSHHQFLVLSCFDNRTIITLHVRASFIPIGTKTWGTVLETNRSKMMTPNPWERFYSFKFLAPNLWNRNLTSNHLFECSLLISWCPTSNIQSIYPSDIQVKKLFPGCLRW